MKKLVFLILVFAMCATMFTGCSPAEEAAAPTEAAAPVETAAPADTAAPTATPADESLQYVLEKGTLVVGFDDAFPPFTYMENDGSYAGFDIAMAKVLTEKLGVELVLQPISWSAKEQELDTYNIDVIWSGLGVVGDRAEVMDVSIPYASARGTVLVRKDSNIKSFADLAGKTVCFQTGGGYYVLFEENDPEALKTFGDIVYLDSTSEMLMSLSTKGVDAVCTDNTSAGYYAKLAGFDFDFLFDDEVMPPYDYAIGLRKGDTALCEKINELLIDIDKEGTAAALSEEWFGRDFTTIKESY